MENVVTQKKNEIKEQKSIFRWEDRTKEPSLSMNIFLLQKLSKSRGKFCKDQNMYMYLFSSNGHINYYYLVNKRYLIMLENEP